MLVYILFLLLLLSVLFELLPQAFKSLLRIWILAVALTTLTVKHRNRKVGLIVAARRML